jgi:hypothetical protein
MLYLFWCKMHYMHDLLGQALQDCTLRVECRAEIDQPLVAEFSLIKVERVVLTSRLIFQYYQGDSTSFNEVLYPHLEFTTYRIRKSDIQIPETFEYPTYSQHPISGQFQLSNSRFGLNRKPITLRPFDNWTFDMRTARLDGFIVKKICFINFFFIKRSRLGSRLWSDIWFGY